MPAAQEHREITSTRQDNTLETPSTEKPEELAIDPPEAEKIEKSPQVSTKFVATSFSGPLPPPDILEGYNKVLPDGAERIVKMAEAEQRYVHKMGGKEMRLQTIGAIGLMVLVALIAGGGFFLILNDKGGKGFALILIALAPLMYSGFLRAQSAPKQTPKEPKPESQDNSESM